MPLRLIATLVCTLTAACTSGPEASVSEQARTKPATAPAEVLRFTREEKDRRQSLELRKRDGGGFEVAISVGGACSRDESGYAKAVKVQGDGEVEVDPDGEGHPTDSFVLPLRDKCRVTIRLAAPDRDYAWLREADCSTSCPLSGRALTRR